MNAPAPHSRLRWIIGAIAGALVLVIGMVAWNIHHNAQQQAAHDKARNDAQAACSFNTGASLDELLNTADTTGVGTQHATTITHTQATLRELAEKLDTDVSNSREADTQRLTTLAQECATAKTTFTQAVTMLETALTQNAQSKHDAAITTARALIESGQVTINNAENKVADNQVRLDAQAALDALTTLASKTFDADVSWKDITTHTSELETATSTATDRLKTLNNAQTEWEATQAGTAQAAEASAETSGGSGSYTDTTYTSGGSSGGASWTPSPTPTAPAAPAPAPAPAPSNSGGWVETGADDECWLGNTSGDLAKEISCS